MAAGELEPGQESPEAGRAYAAWKREAESAVWDGLTLAQSIEQSARISAAWTVYIEAAYRARISRGGV